MHTSLSASPSFENPDRYWLQEGVDAASVAAMFEAVDRFSSMFAWYTLTGRETVRIRFIARGETLHLRHEARYEGPGRLRLLLHIARDDETLAAWLEGLRGETQISVTGVRRDELPEVALREWAWLGREPHELFPQVSVGLPRRRPRADEWHIALRALTAFSQIDPCNLAPHAGARALQLDDGESIQHQTSPVELTEFMPNDGGPLWSGCSRAQPAADGLAPLEYPALCA